MTPPDPPDRVELLVAPDAATTALHAAERIAAVLKHADGTVHLLLAGGTTPRAAYAHLVELVTDWTNIHLWFGDERLVPPDAEDANYRMAAESLIRHVAIPAENVHAVPTHLPLAAAADRYGEDIARHVPGSPPRFDLALLGLGEDGHIASLFPDSATLRDDAVCVAVADAPKPPPKRVSVSLSVLNAARERLVLATGTGKGPALAAAMGPPHSACPASLLRRRELTFVVDAAAAASLTDR